MLFHEVALNSERIPGRSCPTEAAMDTWRWLFSSTVRQVHDICRQIKRLENEQRDLLNPDALAALETARTHARARIAGGAGISELKREIEKLNEAAAASLRPYSNAALRENIKELQVALVSILAFTTFFLQLTHIPTGSMQPSLWGITYENLARQGDPIPNVFTRFLQYWLFGVGYEELAAPFDGHVLKISEEQTILPFVKRQRILFGDPRDSTRRKWLSLWRPPDDRWPRAAEISADRLYHAGEPIVKLRSRAGDYLLVDRFSYNFRPPNRGEVVVFKTKGIHDLPQDVLYIKRLVGLPGEEMRIGSDQHLIINGHRLDERDRGFENVYHITNPGESRYSGHVNQEVAREKFHMHDPLAPFFPDEKTIFKVPDHHFLMMGDNTLNSLDSRSWGSLPGVNVIGRCWFVFWPFTRRFGWNTW
jgi:signal peptidase I